MDNEKKDRLADLIEAASAEALLNLTCPTCAGSINVQFVPKGRRGKGAGSLYVMCSECLWRLIRDGLPTAPPWVRELGPKVQTAKKLVSPRGPRSE